jgi:hypothetical protein
MKTRRLAAALLTGAASVATCNIAIAVELNGLQGHDSLFGEYGPGGDCKREPHVIVDASGITVVVSGQPEKATVLEEVLGFAGPDYNGISKWFFPFKTSAGYPVMMTFNDEEKPGRLTVGGHDEGWQGGPKLSPRNQALVDGSPYQRCAK